MFLPLGAVALMFTGCALRPVAVQEGNLDLGVFAQTRHDYAAGARHGRVRGIGLALGPRHDGIGYFREEMLVVPDTSTPQPIFSPLAEVAVQPAEPAATGVALGTTADARLSKPHSRTLRFVMVDEVFKGVDKDNALLADR